MSEAEKIMGIYYNPVRWLLRRFLDTKKTDEAMLFIAALFAGKVQD